MYEKQELVSTHEAVVIQLTSDIDVTKSHCSTHERGNIDVYQGCHVYARVMKFSKGDVNLLEHEIFRVVGNAPHLIVCAKDQY